MLMIVGQKPTGALKCISLDLKKKVYDAINEFRHLDFKDTVLKTSLNFCNISVGVGKATNCNSDNFVACHSFQLFPS